MKMMVVTPPGILSALAAALLFGASAPLAKMLLLHTSPWMLAATLYLGSGLGLWLMRRLQRAQPVRLPRAQWSWLLGAVLCGGVLAPVLLMTGLAAMPASGAALLLNAEGVFTALLAWFVFKEHIGRRIALGMLAIMAGTLVLSWPDHGEPVFASLWPTLAILLACLGWAVDNNLTRQVALSDASWIAMIKGLVAGLTNLLLALSLGAQFPGPGVLLGALALGYLSYGASLTLFVLALRHLGTARTGAYFSVAPFFGAVLALVLLHEPLSTALLVAGMLMGLGVILHLTESHGHDHVHAALEHEHTHDHGADELHHGHAHAMTVAHGTTHSHWHVHAQVKHTHAHFPDAHHRHSH